MNNDNGRIYYGTGLDNSQLRADAAQARNILQGIGTSAANEGDRIDTAMKKIGASIAGVFAIQQVKDFAVQVATVRGQFQQLEAAFKVLTGDAAVAENLMSQLIHTAATTPFGVTDISNAARQLLAYGVEADKVNETLIRLGDICAGLSIPIGDLAYLYGTTMTQGRLYTADLNQFLGRGIPLADELAKQFGVAKEEIKKMVEEGKVGFPEVQQAIISLTNEGGKFGGLMEAQSKTITGQISNLQDGFEQMFNEIGQSTEGIISDSIGIAASLVENWENVGKTILEIVTIYGAYKAAVIAASAVLKLQASGIAAFTAAEKAHYTWLVLTEKAQRLLNKTMLANPYVLLATSVAALGMSMYNLYSSLDDTDRQARKLQKEIDKLKEETQNNNKAIQEYLPIAKDVKESTEKRKEAINKLKQAYPEYFKSLTIETARNYDVADAVAASNKEYRKRLVLMEKLARQRYEEAKTNYEKNHPKNGQAPAMMGGTTGYSQSSMSVQELANVKQLKKAWETAQAAVKDYDETVSNSGQGKINRGGKNKNGGKANSGGETNNSGNDSVRNIKDETAERNRLIAEYSQSVQETQAQAELDIRQSQIEGMEESYEKQKEQIKLNYDRLIAENKKREQDMINALADTKVLEWQNKHPKATRSETIAYRASLNLTASDLTKEQQDQLKAYQKLAEESMVRGNKEALNTMLQDCLTYEQQRAKVVEEYQKKIEALYEHDENGARVKDANGNDKFKDGVTQGNVDELNYQQEKAVNAIDEQFAQREETYKAWCSYITDKTIDDLKLMLEQAKAALAEMEKSDPSNPQLATARAKVNTLESEIDKKQAKKDVSPDKRSIKEWEDLYKTLNECDKQFEEIGKTIGGVAGENIQTAGEIASSALSMINGIMQLTQATTTGIGQTGQAASKAIQTVEKASVILTIITSAMQIATKIVSLFNNDDKKQEEIEKLQDRIDQLQWELDHADVIQLQNNTFDTLEKLKELTAEATDEIVNMYNAAGKFNSSFYNKIVILRHQSEIAEKTAEKLAKAYANVSYTANKFIGNGNTQYDQANDQLKNYAQQIVLIQEQIDKERSKKDTDNGKIQEWEQKIQELGNEMVEVINGMVEDIMGGSSSDIAQELSDAFFEAFQNGEDYAEAWGDKVDEIVSDILKRMLVQKWLEEPLGDIFNKYKDKWFKDGEFLGLDTVINSLPGLSTDLNNALGNFSEVIEALPDELKNLLNITDEATREASEKGIAQASQDSVDELNGRATAIQGHTYSISENTKLLVANSNRILESVLNIEVNTNGLSARMETVESNVKDMRDTINDIAIKGIKIK